MPTAPNPEQYAAQIVAEHQQMVFRTLARLTGRGAGNQRDDRLEDLAQDVFLRLFRALPTFRGDSTLATYLYRITINVAQNEWKRRARPEFDIHRHVSLSAPIAAPFAEDASTWEDRLPSSAPDALARLQSAEFAALVQQHLNHLSLPERSVLVLYHQEEQSYDQIAAILNLPIGTVRTHLHRGRKKLREALLHQKELAHAG